MEPTLAALIEKRDALRDKLGEFWKAAKSKDDDGKERTDFRKLTADHVPAEIAELSDPSEKSVAVANWWQEQNEELSAVQDQVVPLEAAEADRKQFAKRAQQRQHPGIPVGDQAEAKSLGALFHENYKENDGKPEGKKSRLDIGIKAIAAALREQKTLFETTAGWAPETTRTGFVAEAPTTPLQVIDIWPSQNTGQAAVVYMEETTRTSNAAEVGEGLQKPEDAYELTERSSPVREIATTIPVTEIQLEDVPMVESYLEDRLGFGCLQRLDGQVIAGDGLGVNLEGIMNTAGINTQALAADPVPDAFFKAGTLVRDVGRAVPTHNVMRSSTWEALRLTRTADGIYIWGNPAEAGPMRLWGLPVVISDALDSGAGTTDGLVGSFMGAWIALVERRGIVVDQGHVGSQFRDNQRTIRATGRWAHVVYRPSAFTEVTGLS